MEIKKGRGREEEKKQGREDRKGREIGTQTILACNITQIVSLKLIRASVNVKFKCIFKSHFTQSAGVGMKFGQLIFRKIIKIVAATGHADLKLKCNNIDRFRLGLRPRPSWESIQRSRRPLAGIRPRSESESSRQRARNGASESEGEFFPEASEKNNERVVASEISSSPCF